MGKKDVSITLFHAEWCGHCVDFMPVWNELKETDNINKKINFAEYESSQIKDLDKKTRTIEGKEVNQYPTIKITIFGEEHQYSGERTIEKILGFVKTEIKNLTDKKKTKSTTKTNEIKYVDFSD